MKVISIAVRIAGLVSGATTRVRIANSEAPSMRAASNISLGN